MNFNFQLVETVPIVAKIPNLNRQMPCVINFTYNNEGHIDLYASLHHKEPD